MNKEQPKIYTKTGDQGRTRLVDGRETSKASLRVETYGTLDELNSILGLTLIALRSNPHLELHRLADEIQVVQNQLFTVGCHLACEKEETRKMLPAFEEDWISTLEQSIDQMTPQMPELREFILPGGSKSSSYLHLARTVCRRAERLVVALIEEGHKEPETLRALRYLNRLSDHLFVAARFSNFALKAPDQIWKK